MPAETHEQEIAIGPAQAGQRPATGGQVAVLVLDGEQRAALAVVRSLGRAGLVVHAASHLPRSIAGGSRFVVSEHRLPDPCSGAAEYAMVVGSLARTCGVELVLPVTEPSTLALLEHPEALGDIVLPTSDLARFRRASDKEKVLATAATLGIAVPEQWTIGSSGEGRAAIRTEYFPVVVKPARSVVDSQGARRKVAVQFADSAAELDQALAALGPDAAPFLVQRRIVGPGMGVFLLRWGGELHASFAHRRLREKPPSGGVSVCCESVPPPTALLERSAALLAALDWSGVAMVEYKHDLETGRDYLMEINPRFWGSLQLAIDAGVDFPRLLVELARGRSVPPVHVWRAGRRSRWWWGDIDHLIARLRHSAAALHLPPGAPTLGRTAVEVLLPWRPHQRNDVFRLTDPVPGVRETLGWFRAL